MPVGYKYFEFIPQFIGITPLEKNKLKYVIKTAIPITVWLLAISIKISTVFDYEESSNINGTNETKGLTNSNDSIQDLNEKDDSVSNASKLLLGVLFYENAVYYLIIIIIFLQRRLKIEDAKNDLKTLSIYLPSNYNYNQRLLKYWMFYAVFSCVVCLSIYAIAIGDLFDNYNGEILRILVQNLVFSVNEGSVTFVVEGYLIYYSLFFENQIKELNRTLVEYSSLEIHRQDLRSKIVKLRMKYKFLHSNFGKIKSLLSPLLATSMLHVMSTTCFAIFGINLIGFEILKDWTTMFYLGLKILIGLSKLCVMCVVSDYIQSQVMKTYSIVSDILLSGNEEPALTQQLMILLESKNSISFRFSLAGFCDIRKRIIPTIAGGIVTFTIILCED